MSKKKAFDSIGSRIIKLRGEMSQKELAKLLGTFQARMSSIELEKGEPTIQQLRILKKIFNVSYEYLIDGSEGQGEDIKRVKWLVGELGKAAKKL